MRRSKAEYEALLSNQNVQRGLAVIRATEGTARYQNPYTTAFGGRKFDISGAHPNKMYPFKTKSGKRQKTSAAGAYQFLGSTWRSLAGKLGLKSMSPKNQDIAAVALIDGRGGLDALVKGDLKTFVTKTGPEWASLPTAPAKHDQPKRGWQFVEKAWNSAAPEPVERLDLAALPTPQARPEQNNRGLLSLAGSFSPVSTAHAGEMPKGLLANNLAQPPQSQPDAQQMMQQPDMAGQYAQYQRSPVQQPPQAQTGGLEPQAFDARFNAPQIQPAAQPAQQPAALTEYIADQNATIAANPESMTAEELVMSQPVAATDMGGGLLSPDVAANPESFTPAELAANPSLLSQPAPAAPVQPVPQPVQPVQQPMSAPQAAPPPVFPPPPPTGNDVWNGNAMSGVANGGYELDRQANGDVHRYSPQYDRTDILNPDGSYKSQQAGRITGSIDGGIQTPAFNGMGFAPKTETGRQVRGALGGAAGALAGGLLGPAAGVIGALVGKNLASGGTLGGLLGDNQTTQLNTYNGKPVTVNTYPNAPRPASNSSSGSNRTHQQMSAVSPRAADAVSKGQGGLF